MQNYYTVHIIPPSRFIDVLERDIVSSVQTIFGKYHVPKEKVEIEITESVDDLGKGVLYQAGFSISMDDFGTKYTNLDILSELDFDMRKVDKSLVSLLTKRRSNQIILQNILTMCKHLNISVVPVVSRSGGTVCALT